MDVRNYDWVVRQRGWPVERHQGWYVDPLAAALFKPLQKSG
jgi:TetR/AcrR family transcriptional regulator, regulator of autoinduction and epiphytic fitness